MNISQIDNQDLPDYQASQPDYISTTAGGDGLEFDKRKGSIFEEIKRIKMSHSELMTLERQEQLEQEQL